MKTFFECLEVLVNISQVRTIQLQGDKEIKLQFDPNHSFIIETESTLSRDKLYEEFKTALKFRA